ncbi:hypothetical protein [Mycobacterium sp. NPDC050041]|uniref:hypothetical protein n=1 Tax=Mycobacterium sp. NPDC050041 TaxID=3364293 RepID=UPI003C300D73
MTAGEETTPPVQKWIGLVGLFVAPTTVITALCFYFGYHYLNRYFDYFGIESNALGFTTSDYVLSSVRPLFLPIIALLFVSVATMWLGQFLGQLVNSGRRTRLVQSIAVAAMILGVVGIVRGVVGMTVASYELDDVLALTPVGLGFGSALLITGLRLMASSKHRDGAHTFAATKRASMFAAAAAVVLALFWLTNMYASSRGEDDAAAIASRLWSRETSVVLDTAERLAAPDDLVAEAKLPKEDVGAATTYRYECFRALIVRGDTWVLVPAGWRVNHGYALMIAAGPTNRISMTKNLGIAKTAANDRAGGWQCPEVAPREALVNDQS